MSARRAPPYRPVAVTVWQDMSGLSDDAKLLVLRLRTGPESLPIPGVVPVGRAALAESMGWATAKIDRVLRELIAAGHIEANFPARLFWVPAAAEDAPPQNPNVILGWGRYVGLIPECGLNGVIGQSLRALCTRRGDPFVAAFDEVWSLNVPPNVGGDVPQDLPTNVSQIGGGEGSGSGSGEGSGKKKERDLEAAVSAWEVARVNAKRERPGRPITEPDSPEDLSEFRKRLTESGPKPESKEVGAAAAMFFERDGATLGDLFWKQRQWTLHEFTKALPALLAEAKAKRSRDQKAKEAEEQAEFERRFPLSAAQRRSDPRHWDELAHLLNVRRASTDEKHAAIEAELDRRSKFGAVA